MRKFACGVLVVAYLFLCSCAKEYKTSNTSINTGKQVFDYTEKNLGAFLSFFDIFMRMNSYLAMSEEDSVKAGEAFFPGYNICKLDDRRWAGVNQKDTLWVIETDDLDLLTETAEWNVKSRLASCCGEGVVTCMGLGRWMLELKNVRNEDWSSNAHLMLYYIGADRPSCMDMSCFSVTGSAESVTVSINGKANPMLLNMEIAEPLHKALKNGYLFDSGLIYMQIKDMDSDCQRAVKVALKPESRGRGLKITYKGEVSSYSDETVHF